MDLMDFETYLKQKKIDPETFEKGDVDQWNAFKNLFEQVHPDSFTAQKLFLINKIRRAYPLRESVQPKKVKPTAARPKMNVPKTKRE